MAITVQYRSFDITGTEPTDRTTDGSEVTSGSKLDFGSVITESDANVKVVIFRVDAFDVYSTLSNMRFYLYDKSAFSNTDFYADITDTWTQDKTASQVKSGTPGNCPENEPATENIYKIDAIGSWTVEADMNTARWQLAGGGNSSDALSFGGDDDTGYLATTESWNETSWTSENDMNTAREGLAGGGNSSNALSFGGYDGLATTESWDGTCWASENDMNTGRHYLAGDGNSSNALSFGGYDAGSVLAVTESWNGTCWGSENSLNTARQSLASGGNSSDALSFGGYDGSSNVAITESWDGTCWGSENSLNTARQSLAGGGNSSDALSFGGVNGFDNVTESWNGTCWASEDNLNIARWQLAGGGNSSDALSFGGYDDITEDYHATTESWTVPEDITGTGHSDTSQYIYLTYTPSASETLGSKDFEYRVIFDLY